MSCCGDSNKKFNCGTKHNAACTFYDGCIPDYSEYKDSDCVTIEETTCELYTKQDYILQSIDTTKLEDGCMTYPTTKINGKDVVTIINVLNEHQKKICNSSSGDCDCSSGIDLSGLDLKCLADECNNDVKSLLQVMQLMIDEICILKAQLNNQ